MSFRKIFIASLAAAGVVVIAGCASEPAATRATPAPAAAAAVAATPPVSSAADARAEADRLQTISGIGPVLERVLNDIGIYRFGQLARFTPDNIEWLASRIDWFPQRIQREDWVGQARRLHGEIHPHERL